MKYEIDKWYDASCNNCGRHVSTDFDRGMSRTIKDLSIVMNHDGWQIDKSGKNVCPLCAKENNAN